MNNTSHKHANSYAQHHPVPATSCPCSLSSLYYWKCRESVHYVLALTSSVAKTAKHTESGQCRKSPATSSTSVTHASLIRCLTSIHRFVSRSDQVSLACTSPGSGVNLLPKALLVFSISSLLQRILPPQHQNPSPYTKVA